MIVLVTPTPPLRTVGTGELEALYEALNAAIDVFVGSMQQPRAENAEAFFLAEVDKLYLRRDEVVDELASRRPADEREWDALLRVAVCHSRYADDDMDTNERLQGILQRLGSYPSGRERAA